jgi:uncharacterized membrane protein YqjE
VVTGPARHSASLLELVARLTGEVGRFLDQRLELLKTELKQEAAHTVRSLGVLATGAAGAGIGAMLLLLALGLWVGDLAGSRSGGLAIVGAVLTFVSVALVVVARRSLGRRRLARDTANDLRRDAEWIRHEV